MTNDVLTIRPDMTVNEVIAALPASVMVFGAHGIDSCCGGGKTLAFVSERHGLDLAALIVELEGLAAG